MKSGGSIQLVRNSAPIWCEALKKSDFGHDDTVDGVLNVDTYDLSGWTIYLWVKRDQNDPDERALISDSINQPTAASVDHSSSPLNPLVGEYGFNFTGFHTNFPPRRYPAEIRYWRSGGSYAAGDPPFEVKPFTFELIEANDLPGQ